MMAYHGADVVKVEPLTGDPIRTWRGMDEGTSLWWRSLSRNKRCTAIDLRQPRGQHLVRKLIDRADVLIENFRPGTLEKWQLSPALLRESNPGLVIARVSGYGQTGPRSKLPGYASACEAYGGFRKINGMPAGPPVRPNLSLGDSLTGLHACLGIMLSLYQRDRIKSPHFGDGDTRSGQTVDCAIYESVFNMLESIVPEYDRLGEVRQPSGTTITGVAPSGSYLARDNKYVVIGANTPPVFERLCHTMGTPELSHDSNYADNEARVRNQVALDKMIGDWVASLNAAEVTRRLQDAAVPCSVIYDVADMFADDHYQARGMFETVDAAGRPLALPAMPPKLQTTPGATHWAGPDLGAHTSEILTELGLDANQQGELRRAAIVA